MRYLTLHQTQSDYDKLVLDESNIPHVADILETGRIVYTSSNMQSSYNSYKVIEGNLWDKNGNKIIVK